MEIWKDAYGFEHEYEVSNLGRVRGKDRVEQTRGRYGLMSRKRGGKILAVNMRNGYESVELHINGISKRVSVHRLTFSTFVSPDISGLVIHHIDGNKVNNAVKNLKALSFSAHLTEHPRVVWNKGMKGYRAGIPRPHSAYASRRKKVRCIETREVFESVTAAGKQLKREVGTVIASLKNEHRTAGGFHFEYVNE